MKAWTLIGFYLLKDIWRRWFETPGGVLSRLLVAFILGLLLLVIDAAFTLSAASIQEKISQMGVRTLVMTRAVTGAESEADLGNLARLVTPLRSDGVVLRLMQTGRYGQDEFGKQRAVYLYDRDMLENLLPILPSKPETGVFVISEEYPPGMPTHVTVDQGPEIDGCMVLPPSWLPKFGANPSSILLPEEEYSDLANTGFFELIVFLGADDSDLLGIESNLRSMLNLEDLGNVQLTSPRELLAQLDELQDTQRRWRGGFGLFGGLAVSLVFGSISILEYRQNRFIIALLKSFGAPSVLLVARYLLESLLLVTIAALLARSAAIYLHPLIFQTIGIEPNLIDRNVIDPYVWTAIWPQLRGLGLGALLSVLPVAFAMRTPVGRILA